MGQRPEHVKPPAYLSENTPVPEPDTVAVERKGGEGERDATRYGDWELKGVAVDF